MTVWLTPGVEPRGTAARWLAAGGGRYRMLIRIMKNFTSQISYFLLIPGTGEAALHGGPQQGRKAHSHTMHVVKGCFSRLRGAAAPYVTGGRWVDSGACLVERAAAQDCTKAVQEAPRPLRRLVLRASSGGGSEAAERLRGRVAFTQVWAAWRVK